MTHVIRRGSTSTLLQGRRNKRVQETLPSRLSNPNDVQRLITRNITDEQIEEIRARRLGTEFHLDGIAYRVCSVYRDEYQRILEVGTRAASE